MGQVKRERGEREKEGETDGGRAERENNADIISSPSALLSLPSEVAAMPCLFASRRERARALRIQASGRTQTFILTVRSIAYFASAKSDILSTS